MTIHITTDELNKASLSTREASLGSALYQIMDIAEKARFTPSSDPGHDLPKVSGAVLQLAAKAIDLLLGRRKPSNVDASKLKMLARLSKLVPPEITAGCGITDIDEAESYSFEIAAAVQEHLHDVNAMLPRSPGDRFDSLFEDALYDNVSEWEESRRMLRDQYEYRNETREEQSRSLAGE